MLSKLFKSTEIRSQQGVLHFRRWRLIETKFFRFYIHQIFESDRDAHMHSHPWNFLSFVLSGGYVEKHGLAQYRVVTRFKFNFHTASDYHKLTLIYRPTVSAFFAFGKYRPWGYQTSEGHIDSTEYRERKSNNTLPQ